MKNITSAARIVFGIPFVVFGLDHFLNAKEMAAAALANWPAAIIFIYISGAGLVLAGISFIINRYVRLAGMLLALELLIIVLAIQVPGIMNPATMQMSFIGILKDLSLIAASIYIAGTAGTAEVKA
ncbi:MAG: DoxX family membrane protein [Ignavibacteria bacterium]|nr:DoxX family membrane protein [Ignavibacteria bacterium]